MQDMARLTSSERVTGVSFTEMEVPGCLEMQGYGTPYYMNDNYAFYDYPPYIYMKTGVENGVGSYRRTFSLPAAWAGERVYLHFDGIYGGAYVWVNGKKVGYSQGSNNDAEFDITNYAKAGTNILGVQNIRWTDGSYLEGQDMWHMSGIHRNVYLYALPEGSIRDHQLSATFSEDYSNATLTARIRGGRQVLVRLIAPDGTTVGEKKAENVEDGVSEVKIEVPEVQLWSAEYPNLYTVEFSQRDANGKEQMAFATKYGFREITNTGKLILINGQRVYFRGVNTQDTDPLTGRTMPLETMLKDITMMKQANVNTVRTSHYPRSPRMMHMFDYYGMYVMDEADLECHRNWTDNGTNGISSQESWLPAMQDRTDRMILRDRNHASVIFWSLGNESCWGENFNRLYTAAKALDGESGRPIHYEGGSRGGAEGQSDLFSQMYPTTTKVTNNSSNCSQPYFICEYAHAMGNAIGNLKEYWKPIYYSNYGVGACIWDWVDQSIYDANDITKGNLISQGLPRYKSGYDYGSLHQDNFLNNGILTADRKANGKLAEVKAIYAPIQVIGFSANTRKLRIRNVDSFRNLNEYECRYTVLIDGYAVENGIVDLPSIEPLSATTEITIPCTTPEPTSGEMLLNISFHLRQATSWAGAGHTVAQMQYFIKRRTSTLPAYTATTNEDIKSFRNGTTTTIGNSQFFITFEDDGTLTAYSVDGKSLILEGPEYDNFRWIENDKYSDMDNGLTDKTAEITLSEDKRKANVKVTAKGNKCPYTLNYTIYTDGTFDIQATMRPAVGDLRRIGLAMTLAPELENIEYWGRGPEENYWDRKDGCYIGRYSNTVTGLFENYPHPQTCGGREDIREVCLYDDEGKGILVTTAHSTTRQVAMQLLHHRDMEMTSTRLHPYDLTPSEEIYAHFDIYQRGLGNGSCGQGTGTLETYKCPSSGSLVYYLRFSPYDKATVGVPPTPLRHSCSSATYDIEGRSLSFPTRGIYLQAGRKLLKR